MTVMLSQTPVNQFTVTRGEIVNDAFFLDRQQQAVHRGAMLLPEDSKLAQ